MKYMKSDQNQQNIRTLTKNSETLELGQKKNQTQEPRQKKHTNIVTRSKNNETQQLRQNKTKQRKSD